MGRRILLVDDEVAVLLTLKAVLEINPHHPIIERLHRLPRTPSRDRCIACRGDGTLPRRRLRALVLRGVRGSASALR